MQLQSDPISPRQCRMARAALNWTRADLCVAAKVGKATISRFEGGSRIKDGTRRKLQNAFMAKGLRFIDDGGCEGVCPPRN